MKQPQVKDRMLTNRHLQERYGVTRMTVSRWRSDPKVNFPKPDVVIKTREYWSETRTIEPWERASVKRKA